MIHFSLFSGIGGFELASEWAGWNNYLSCEINSFGNKILNHYWPNAYHHEDIHTLNYKVIDDELTKRYGSDWRTDDIILTGGFPCQPYSGAGKRLGKEDDRHLWPEMLRIIREVQPTWVVGENVFGLINWNDGLVFDEVQSDLEAEGYEVQPYVLPAASVGAPHRRDRVWFVAYNKITRITPQTDTRRREMEKSKPQNGYEFRDMPNPNGSSGSTPDTNRDGQQSRNSNSERGDQREQGSQGIRKRLQSKTITDGNTWLTPNPSSKRHRRWNKQSITDSHQERQVCAEERHNRNGIWSKTKRRSTNASDTNNGDKIKYWQDFPTQSPICGGDDGIPSQLDGITFPKWRNESIKAYGNAIVPQVAYQIFKAINEYGKI